MAKKKKRKLSAWQKHVKSYMASHKGLSFKEALPKAKLTYQKVGSNPTSPRASKNKPRKVKKKMAKKKTRRSRQMTIPLTIAIPAVGGTVAAAKYGWDHGWGIEGAIDQVSQAWTGFSFINKTFDMNQMWRALFPTIFGAVIHKFVGGPPLNVNRLLAAAKIPLIRI